jgi:hypothetical protein
MELSRCVLARRKVDLASAHFAASIDGFLQGRPGIIALAARRAVTPDIEDALRRSGLTEDGQRDCPGA